MYLYNYSGLKDRDTKIYNVGGYNIAGGFSVQFLTVVGPVFLVFLILGAILGAFFGISMIPMTDGFSLKWLLFWLFVGIGIGCALWYIQFSGYRLYQYLIAYFKPKKVYTNDFRIKEFKLTNIKVKGFIKNIL